MFTNHKQTHTHTREDVLSFFLTVKGTNSCPAYTHFPNRDVKIMTCFTICEGKRPRTCKRKPKRNTLERISLSTYLDFRRKGRGRGGGGVLIRGTILIFAGRQVQWSRPRHTGVLNSSDHHFLFFFFSRKNTK